MNKQIKIGSKIISEASPAFIVAEISGNHNGSIDRALEIIREAAKAGADAVKLQTYRADTITIDCDSPVFKTFDGSLWEGRTLYNLYEEAYTPWEWQPILKREAEKLGLECFSTPFDDTSVDFLEKMEVKAYKIASYEINDIPLIRRVAALHKPVILATGVAFKEDIDRAVNICREVGNEDVMILKCVSAYPTPMELVNLKSMVGLAKDYDCLVGLSDHTPGSVVPIGSIALGAKMIEKHLTLKRSEGGVDSGFSMEPEEFAAMVRDVRSMEKALGTEEYILTEKQKKEHALSRSLFVVKDIKRGEAFTGENIKSIRPGAGMHTMYYTQVLGKKATRDLKKGEPLEESMVEGFLREEKKCEGK